MIVGEALDTVRVSPDAPHAEVNPLLLPSVSVKVACQKYVPADDGVKEVDV